MLVDFFFFFLSFSASIIKHIHTLHKTIIGLHPLIYICFDDCDQFYKVKKSIEKSK